jgi:hypothetical protein
MKYYYHLNDFQAKMRNEIKSLPQRKLYYLTAQQSNQYLNLTLPELKKLIRKGIRKYIQQIEPRYYKGLENEILKFYCVFETKKEFNLSQQKNELVSTDTSLGLHFHLFLSSPNNYSWISFDALIYQIFCELTSIKHKKNAISKYGYFKIDNLEEFFMQYHTKQFVNYPSNEMIYKNI